MSLLYKKILGIGIIAITAIFAVGSGNKNVPPVSDTPTQKEVNEMVRSEIEKQNNQTEEKTIPVVQKTIPIETKSETKSVVYYSVTKVVDGDTLAINMDGKSQTLRLIGLDTPETVDPRKPVQCFGVEASNKAKSILTGQQVHIETDPTQDTYDKYNRLLVYVFLKNGTLFNKMMVEEGYGHEYTYNAPYKYQSEFKTAENNARANEKGLWANGVCNQENITAPTQAQNTVPVVVATPPVSSNDNCTANIYNCSNFKTHAEAQAVYEACGGLGHDIHRLDANKDGEACESLP